MIHQLQIVTGSPTPIYKQIVSQVLRQVTQKHLKPGDPLPSVRRLAEHLVVNPNTVAKAYGELVRDGVIESHQGRGYLVVQRRDVFSQSERRRRFKEALATFLDETNLLGFSEDEVKQMIEKYLQQGKS